QYELDDEYTGGKILQALCDNLHHDYPETAEPLIAQPPEEQSLKRQKLGSRILQRLQPQDKPQLSDIDRFNSARVEANDMEDPKNPGLGFGLNGIKSWKEHVECEPERRNLDLLIPKTIVSKSKPPVGCCPSCISYELSCRLVYYLSMAPAWSAVTRRGFVDST
ncbi:hypothetical protein V1522DRAFT_42413, partial [Lipomyces starkeyi]